MTVTMLRITAPSTRWMARIRGASVRCLAVATAAAAHSLIATAAATPAVARSYARRGIAEGGETRVSLPPSGVNPGFDSLAAAVLARRTVPLLTAIVPGPVPSSRVGCQSGGLRHT